MAKPKYGDYSGGIFVTLLPYFEEEEAVQRALCVCRVHLVRSNT